VLQEVIWYMGVLSVCSACGCREAPLASALGTCPTVLDWASFIGSVGAVIGVVFAALQLRQANRNLKRGLSPILMIDPTTIGGEPLLRLSSVAPYDYPVVTSVSFRLRNDGNGPALNMTIDVRQNKLALERAIHPSWPNRSVAADEVSRDSVARGESLECFFRARAGFSLPDEGPVTVEVKCQNAFRQTGVFKFELPADAGTVLAEQHRSFVFREMRGF